MKKNLKVGFVGLTHLGLTYLAASSEKGFKVIGIDFNQNKINQLKKFDIEYKEPDLQKTIFQNKRNILFSSNLKNLMDCNIVFISQDISTNDKGKGDFKSLKKLINSTFKFLNKKSVLVILSQVQPGFTRLINFDHTRLYYQVETLIFGNALERALTPERIIIGCESSESKINRLLLNYLDNYKCPIIRMKYESAELTKISINLLLASSITTTNMLAQACEKVSADWYEIIPALQLDQRIGRKAYIRPGLGISGGNVERDIGSIEKILKKDRRPLSIIKVFQRNSVYMKSWVYRILEKEKVLSQKSKHSMGILGLAYKENTNSVKNSPTLNLLRKLKNNKITIYDPAAKLEEKIKNCNQINNINFLLKISNVIIVMTPWNEFKKVSKILEKHKKKNIILIDPYRIININIVKNKYIKYFTIGKK